jgi:hypothetical protein
MSEDDLALCARTFPAAEIPAAEAPESAVAESHAADGPAAAEPAAERRRDQALSVRATVNWLRYMAKCKQRLSDVSYGTNGETLSFQAHVMREAARHLETLGR